MGDYVTADKVRRDPVSGGQVVTEAAHYEVHECETYEGTGIFRSLADNNVVGAALRVGDTPIHLTWGAHLGGTCEWLIYEDCTLSASGSARSLHNMNRTCVDQADELLFTGVSLGVSGTLLAEGLAPAGEGPRASGGTLRQGVERVFSPGRWYALVLTNTSGGAIDGSFQFEFYEGAFEA